MSERALQCFGGPLHGQKIAHQSHRWEVEQRLFDQHNVFDGRAYNTDWTSQVTYFRQRFAQSRIAPRGRKIIDVFVVEGHELTKREAYELARAADKMPWELEQASILTDFHQWFARSIYRQTGRLWWINGWVC